METSNILGIGPQTVVHPHRTYGKRTVPMKVLCLGYGRTGTRCNIMLTICYTITLALRDQLLTLGFHHTYHTFDAVHRDAYDCKLWMDLLSAKYDHGQKPSREDFDKLLGHCQAVIDMPAAYFAEELIEYYPEAKVILTIRDYDEWERSHKSSLLKANRGFLPPFLAFTAILLRMPNRWTHPMFLKLQQVLYNSDFDRNGITSMKKHYEKVRSLVPPERLLEYHVSDGWEPLCEFLDKPVPAAEPPYINSSTTFIQRDRSRLHLMLKAQLKRVLDIAAYLALTTTIVSSVYSWVLVLFK
ncbi:hypothetical protein BGZ63DRAFT_360352 [Mariannaea sp. PMI_226]|nr:hypothetical protein BGZ63DRAFT_360352 [Mariannaea sp. PMI_226]